VTKHPIEVIASVERRRRWSREDKERLVGLALSLMRFSPRLLDRPASTSASSFGGARNSAGTRIRRCRYRAPWCP